MNRKSKRQIISLTTIITLFLFGLVACIKNNNKEVLGYAPVYGDMSDLTDIKSENPIPYENAGKIYKYLQYTFQIENGKGIHVINAIDPSNASKISFIKVKGCSEISIKNNILYTDNFRDLVGINISNIKAVQVVSRIEKVFPGINQESPPVEGVFFECVNQANGMVIGWTQKMLSNPKCKK